MDDQNKTYKEYMDKFYEPELTALEFTQVLICLLKLSGIKSFKHEDIEQHILDCKNCYIFTELLKEINFKSNGKKEYSIDFQDSITSVRNSGLIYSVSPEQDSTVIIKEFDEAEYLKIKKYYIYSILSFLLIGGLISENQCQEVKIKLTRLI